MIFLNFLVSYIYAINQTSKLVFLDTLIRSIQQVVSSTTRVSCLHLVYPPMSILRRCEPSSHSSPKTNHTHIIISFFFDKFQTKLLWLVQTLNTSPQKVLHPSRGSALFPNLSGGRDAHSAAGLDQFEEAWPKVQGIPKDEELVCSACSFRPKRSCIITVGWFSIKKYYSNL